MMSEFERWETRFAAPGYLFGTEPNAFLKSQAHLLRPGQKALSVADGEGRNGVWLATQGLDVHSFDFSPQAVAKARELAKQRGVTLKTKVADLFTWTWPTAEFDVIAAIFFQFVGPDMRDGVFAGIKKALKPGGLLLMEGYHLRQREFGTGGPSDVANLWTRDLLERAFSDFSSVQINEEDRELAEGHHHVGMSALIDFVGRK
jgi:cyclopropane fatty-acyl-phospholipid synthase-like methyltransferase